MKKHAWDTHTAVIGDPGQRPHMRSKYREKESKPMKTEPQNALPEDPLIERVGPVILRSLTALGAAVLTVPPALLLATPYLLIG